MTDELTRVDRRTTLRWLAGAMATSAAAACGAAEAPRAPAERATASLGTPRPITGTGYGRYPDTLDSTVTWARTMTEAQLRLTRALADMIVPAGEGSPSAGALGAQDFVDEWVSAPYADQQADRTVIFDGLEWTEQAAMDRTGGARFIDCTRRTREGILDDIAHADRVAPGLEDQALFFGKLRFLVMSAFYATREGWAEIGYLGNAPMGGAYPGPTPEAMAHLEAGLKRLGLPMPALAARVPDRT